MKKKGNKSFSNLKLWFHRAKIFVKYQFGFFLYYMYVCLLCLFCMSIFISTTQLPEITTNYTEYNYHIYIKGDNEFKISKTISSIPKTKFVTVSKLESKSNDPDGDYISFVVDEGMVFHPYWKERVDSVISEMKNTSSGQGILLRLVDFETQMQHKYRCNSRICQHHSFLNFEYYTQISKGTSYLRPTNLFSIQVLSRKRRDNKTENKNKKLYIYISTKNRKEYIEKQALSLKGTSANVVIFDDESDEYSNDFLKRLYGTSKVNKLTKPEASHNPTERGNYITYQMLIHFLDLDEKDAVLIIADSDMIFHRDWEDWLYRNYDHKSNDLFTLYNSCQHKTLNCEEEFCEKKSVGNAGTVWSYDLALKVIMKVNRIQDFDWSYSKYLKDNNIKMKAAHPSMLEHVGSTKGSHGIGSMNEMSVDFPLYDNKDLAPFLKKNLVDRLGCSQICDYSALNSLLFGIRSKTTKYSFIYCKIIKKIWI